MTFKSIVRRLLAQGMDMMGILSLVESSRRAHGGLILMYHRILTPEQAQPYHVQPGMYVTPASFERQMAFLKKRWDVVSLDEIVDKVMAGESLAGLCAVTFDDGWRDNYTEAFPILKKLHVPATIFLAAGYIGTRSVFWPEELCYYLKQAALSEKSFKGVPDCFARFVEGSGRYSQRVEEGFFEAAVDAAKRCSPEQRRSMLEYFKGVFSLHGLPRQMLSWDEAREMLSSGLVRFGAHTVNHDILDQVPLETARDEVVRSRTLIEDCLGSKVRVFAYPNGNHTSAIRQMVAEGGFDAAVTTRKGLLCRGMPPMELSRIGIHQDVSHTIPLFRSRLIFEKM